MNTTAFSDIFLPATFAVITFGLGLSISFVDIRNIITQPRNITVGLFSQLILLPLIAFAIAMAGGFKTKLAVGLILISICPGRATSNLVNYMIRGNVAFSIYITVLNGLITQLALNVFMQQDASIQLLSPECKDPDELKVLTPGRAVAKACASAKASATRGWRVGDKPRGKPFYY